MHYFTCLHCSTVQHQAWYGYTRNLGDLREGFFLAPDESCTLRLHWKSPSGPQSEQCEQRWFCRTNEHMNEQMDWRTTGLRELDIHKKREGMHRVFWWQGLRSYLFTCHSLNKIKYKSWIYEPPSSPLFLQALMKQWSLFLDHYRNKNEGISAESV